MDRQYDLTPRMMPYLDRHLVFPLLQFLSLKELYAEEDLLQAKYDLLSKTSMVDYTKELYKQIHHIETDPEEFSERRENVLAALEKMQAEAAKVTEVIENPDVINALRQDKYQNLQFLKENYNFTTAMLETLYHFGKLQYDCGNYGGASVMLYHFRVLSIDTELNLSSWWGKLASEILEGNWDVAYDDMLKLREVIDTKAYSDPIQQLQQRTWLIHWSLFVFFNHPKGRDGIVDMFFMPQYLNTIQTSCPWMLRYLTAAVITNKRRRSYLKELVSVVQQESYMYRDPITDFLLAIYVDFDFELAQKKLLECEEVLDNDYFLMPTLDDFLENARFFVAEVYCRIHQRINISELSARINLSAEEGEKWIANLIQETRMDAKIDHQENTVVMNPNLTSLYQQVIEKTKSISFRSQVLSNAIDKREHAAAAGGSSTGEKSKDGSNDNRNHSQHRQQQRGNSLRSKFKGGSHTFNAPLRAK